MHKALIAVCLAALLIAGLAVGSSAAEVARTERTTQGSAGKIAFVREIRGKENCAILVVRDDGSEQRRLTRWSTNCGTPVAWSPDGTRLAYYARGALWLMNDDGSKRQRLAPATYEESGGAGPSFSPDGQSVAFTHNPSSKVNASAIYTIRIGGRPRRLTPERFAWAPAWSPLGNSIAYISERETSFEIRVMRSDGTGQRRMVRTDEPAEDWLVWAPDGLSLAYMFDSAIFSIRATGAKRRLLTHSADYIGGFDWASDGRTIVFGSDTDLGDLYLMDAKGHNERPLTRRFYSHGPSWSPDSRRVAFGFFTRLKGPSRDGIAVINEDGRNRRELTMGLDSYPAWQPLP